MHKHLCRTDRIHFILIISLLILILGSCSTDPPGTVIPVSLTCEYSRNPLGIESQNPKLSWKLVSDHKNQVQKAYQILVASSSELLAEDKGDVWNSGKVSSGQSVFIHYKGGELVSGHRYYWKVRVWDKNSGHQTGVNRHSGKWDCWIRPTGRQIGLLIIVREHHFSERHSTYQEKSGRPAFTYAVSVILNFA